MAKSDTQYTVLARRFRPQTFDEVIGQNHVAQALRNAIRTGRVAHAYLFTGVRGVGKTSMARILAKALNCPHAEDGNPCNTCEICESISMGQDVDVLEIDGASNRGIDDIRTLRANVNVRSMRTRYKVYIIDEVHMLTKEAFNALLKTLEEPPPNVKFVFCTTEPQKVPDTILSRCQRFDFTTIATQSIIERLRQIAETEGFQVDADALELVARRAAGSLRDSQSLFDQLLAFGEQHLTARDVHRLLGTAEDNRLIALGQALIHRQQDVALQEFADALTEGVQLSEFFQQLIHYLRDLMVLAAKTETVELMSVSSTHRAELIRQAEQWGLETIVAALQILSEAQSRMFRSGFARPLAEMALVRLCLLPDLDQLALLIRTLQGGDGPGQTTVPPPSVAKQRSPASVGTSRGTPPPSASVPPPGSATPSANLSSASYRSPASTPSSAPLVAHSADRSPGEQGVSLEEKNSDKSDKEANPAASPSQPEEVSPSGNGTHIPIQPGAEEDLMPQLLMQIDDATRPHLKAARIAISGPNQVDLLFAAGYHFSRHYCDRPEIRTRIQNIIQQITGSYVNLRVLVDESAPAGNSSGENKPPASAPPGIPDWKKVEKDEFVQQAMEIFGAVLKDVRPLAPPVSEPATNDT